jgi:uncharacterized metal-binding protein
MIEGVSDMQQEQLQTIAEIGSKMQYTGSGVAIVFGWMNEYAAALGVVIGVMGLLINWYYKSRVTRLIELDTDPRDKYKNRELP